MSQHPTEDTPRLAALRHRDFRLLWAGETVSVIGAQMQLIAINWHVYALLKGDAVVLSVLGQDVALDAGALGLGVLGLVRVVPIVVFALVGGMLADIRDRRQVMLWTRVAAAVFAAILAAITFTDHATVAAIYLLTAAGAAVSAFDAPAQQSIVPHLVPPAHMTNAISLNTLQWQIGTIIGPAIAGLLIRDQDIGMVYAITALTFAVAVGAVRALRYRGHAAASTAGLGCSALLEGLRFTYRSRIIWSTMLLDFFATFFSSARTMLPIVADQVLGLGPEGYGLLATAQPVGALVAGAATSLRRDIYHQGAVLLVSVAVYGLATAFFGVATAFALSYFFFALTGAGDTVSTVIRGTIRQMMTPDALRGRMVGVNMIFFMGGPQLGELEAGLVAAAFGAPFAIFTGGLATVLLTAWIAWRYPGLRRYTSDALAAQRAA
ncbi:MAG: MFS transporter [Anaerolineae bacterium]